MTERITAAEYRQLAAQPAKKQPRVRGAKATVVDGIRFDSKLEAERWTELKLLERAGDIRELERQVLYRFEVNGVLIGQYRADFRYFDCRLGRPIVEDAKGWRTETYRWKKKAMLAFYGIAVQEVSKKIAAMCRKR